MLKRFHVIHPKIHNFTQKNALLPKILSQTSLLTKIILYFYLILQPETQNLLVQVLLKKNTII